MTVIATYWALTGGAAKEHESNWQIKLPNGMDKKFKADKLKG